MKELGSEDQLVVFLPGIRETVCGVRQILDRLVTQLITMTNLTKLSGQKRVNDRSDKNDGRNKVERLALNAPDEFSEKRRSLLVAVTVDRQRKVCSRFQYLCSRISNSSQTQ